ncbi:MULTISPECIES: hypothetical protein [unclassified Streptomyces]|uniref:hypothetical protein n=1 Tax=unclassified Streptomyces TaxID=2593676 RepID=UPI002E81109E|nr:hypothetical protein [Streptomyces sp. NBC_00589]WTI36352.1 hypothetical protein OIC96_15725 [Streptomyces sp. NBC_00775]WUB29973.1 hypothetical protein OHA51_34005 [Streptomyces sp. NBC_00589]
MTAAGGRRRLWRWVLAVWMVTVVVGGGLTLWLQDAAEPERPGGWEKNQESPAPLLRLDDLPSSCPSIKKGEDGLCFIRHRP